MTNKLDRLVANEISTSGVKVTYLRLSLHCYVSRFPSDNWRRIKIAICALTDSDPFQDLGDGTCQFELGGGTIKLYSETG